MANRAKKYIQPEVPREFNSRNVRDWCKGKIGLEHDYHWVRPRWMVNAVTGLPRSEEKVCSACGRIAGYRTARYSFGTLLKNARESEGLTRACSRLGRKLDLVAVNHWQLAIETHAKNHPDARHVCAALEGLNPRDLVPSGRLNLLVASPECTNHSVARGGRPINDQSRASAWLILKWLQELYVESILIENVPEFREWGPLGADGKPLKSKKGDLFRQFIATLKSLGYAVEYRILNAANYGDPTTRQRLFIVGRRGRNKAISWPAQTHAPTHRTGTLFGELRPWRPAREILDWSIPSRSIYRRRKPLAENTLQRILAGTQKFKWPEPFIVVLRRHMAARSIDEPLPTLTAGGTHLGLCEPFMVPMNRNKDRLRSVEEPVQTVTATSSDIGLVEPFITTVSHGQDKSRCRSIDDPLPTVTGANDHAVVQPFTMKFDHAGSNNGRARSIDSPLPTITTKNGLGIVQPFLTKFYGTGGVACVDDPLDTVTARDRFGLCEPVNTLYDIGFRMLHPRELARAQGFPDHYQFAGNSAQITKLIGNAVPVNLAEALCRELLTG